ncbi:hypothetical protein Tco_1131458, partial [Tanacetum coccineum]
HRKKKRAFGRKRWSNIGSPNPNKGRILLIKILHLQAPMTFADLANWNIGDSEFLTPPKRLLNSIDIIKTVVREELQNLKRTPNREESRKGEKGQDFSS